MIPGGSLPWLRFTADGSALLFDGPQQVPIPGMQPDAGRRAVVPAVAVV